MPQVAVAVVAAAAAKGAAAALVAAGINAAVAAIAGAVIGGVISYAASAIFATKPKFDAPDLSKLSGRSQMVRQPITTRKIVIGELPVSGPVTFFNVTDGKRKLQWLITLAGHSFAEIGDIWFGDQLVFSGTGNGEAIGRYAGYARFWKGLGTVDGDAALQAAMEARNPGKWTSAHRQYGCAKLYCELDWDADIYPGGIPQIKCMVKAKDDIHDPRTGTTGYSNNWALAVADFIAKDHGWGAGWDAIDEDELIASANVSDEDIDLADDGTEKRYTVNGILDTGAEPQDNLRDLLNPGGGMAVRSGRTWRVLAGYFRENEVIEITDDWMAGPVKYRPRQPGDKAFNTIRAVYAGPKSNWQPTDLPVRKSDAFIAQDGGKESAVDREYLLTSSDTAGQRLMQMEQHRARLEGEFDLVCNLKAFKVRLGSVVRMTRARNGFNLKPFEVVNWRLRQDFIEDAPVLLIDLTLREIDQSAFEWSTTDEMIVAARGQSDLPRPWDVAPPDGLDVAEVQYQTREGGGVKSKAVLSAGVADDAFVVSYQFESRKIGVLDWTVYPRVTDPFLEIFDIPAGVYDFRVKAVNRAGASSAYVTLRREIYGLGGKPLAATGLTISALGGLAVLRWDRSPDLDVRMGGQVRFRWSPASSNPLVSESATIGAPVPGGDTMAVLPLKPGCYLLQFVDGSGSVSDATWVSTDGATVLEYGAVDELVESPAWSGGLDNLVVDGGSLKLVGSGMFDDIPVFDDITSLDGFGGIVASGLYTHASGHDFTTKSRRVISASVTLQTINVIDLFDQREGTVDSWASFDGETSGEGDAITWYSTTDDDPAGSPSWSSWQRLDRAEVYCRAVQYRTEVTVSDGSYNVLITDLRVRAESLS